MLSSGRTIGVAEEEMDTDSGFGSAGAPPPHAERRGVVRIRADVRSLARLRSTTRGRMALRGRVRGVSRRY